MYLYGRHEYTINLKDHTAPPGFASFLKKWMIHVSGNWFIFCLIFFKYFVLEKINFVHVSELKRRNLYFHVFYRLKLIPNGQKFTQLGHLIYFWNNS